MPYIEIQLTFNEPDAWRDIAVAALGEAGCESFSETEDGLLAYVKTDDFAEGLIAEQLSKYLGLSGYKRKDNLIPDQNWNAAWESSFEPIVVDDLCRVRAPFHRAHDGLPEIIIEPKMSFGTGHHDTTYLMLRHLFKLEMRGKSLLDMGCGTGVLAIAAEMRGAEQILAVDIEPWAAENAEENAVVNGCRKIRVLCGDRAVVDDTFDIVLANINRNVLLADMCFFAEWLCPGGQLLLSGFFPSDIPVLETEAKKHGFTARLTDERNGWACLLLMKSV